MIDIVQQVLNHYFSRLIAPKVQELKIPDITLHDKKWNVFVTLYKNGEVRGSAGNIKEIHENIIEELIANTMEAATMDERFEKITVAEKDDIKIRIDVINTRKIIDEATLRKLDPVKNGVIVIKRDYKKLAVILPNISPNLITGSDTIEILGRKLGWEKVNDNDFIIYQIETEVETNY